MRFFRRLQSAIVMLMLCLTYQAMADISHWERLKQQAQGQTVYFNAWGGDAAANAYLRWVATEMQRQYAITVKLVSLSDTADAVRRIQAEAAAGRREKGSVDLLWLNGENFKTLKMEGLLSTGWAEQLPNWQYVDTTQPVREDFSIPTEGAESPWGRAQLMLIADRERVPNPPSDPASLLAFIQRHPGQLTYPRPPDFIGTAFLKQLLLSLTSTPEAFSIPPQPEQFATLTAPLWQYLDQLHPLLWRQGRDFPASAARIDRLLGDGVVMFSLTFNPAHVANLIAGGQLPASAYAFGFQQGMLGNVHFVAIPFNSDAKAGAQVVANFLLSPQAQLRKADPKVWGDPTILDRHKLPQYWQAELERNIPGTQAPLPVLAEPNSAWIPALEAEWLKRYGVR
ncbi:ABC transporter substrate-binding protein [Serratia sp. UGAL515B_01]|uniref:ABC transporter substrate-binding protein n=1 Tax=Serratia sp. UGAL515B_01 TaxID=2986763 RepID=UPI003986195D